MKTQKKTDWMRPYVEACRDLIPTNRITAINGYSVPKNKYAATYGSCVKRGKYFTINMRIYRYDKKAKHHVPMFLGNLLENFAHELSHTVPGCMDHNPKQVEMCGLILSRFGKVLKQLGIKDTYKTRMNFEDIK